MYIHQDPRSFRSGAVVPLLVTDEENRPIKLPRTVQEACNLPEPEAAADTASEPSEPDLQASAMAEAERLLGPAIVVVVNCAGDGGRKSSILGSLMAIKDEIADFLAVTRAAELVVLRDEHRAKVLEIRAVYARIDELNLESATTDDPLRTARTKLNEAQRDLKRVAGSEPSEESFALPEEIEQWKMKKAKAQKVVDAAENVEARIVDQRRTIANKIAEEYKLLNGHRANIAAVTDRDRPGLLEEASVLLAKIKGRVITDRATGLRSELIVLRP